MLPSKCRWSFRPRAGPPGRVGVGTRASGRRAEAAFPEHGQQRPGGVEDGLQVRRIQLPPRFQQQGRSVPEVHTPEGGDHSGGSGGGRCDGDGGGGEGGRRFAPEPATPRAATGPRARCRRDLCGVGVRARLQATAAGGAGGQGRGGGGAGWATRASWVSVAPASSCWMATRGRPLAWRRLTATSWRRWRGPYRAVRPRWATGRSIRPMVVYQRMARRSGTARTRPLDCPA